MVPVFQNAIIKNVRAGAAPLLRQLFHEDLIIIIIILCEIIYSSVIKNIIILIFQAIIIT